jgi:phenylalanyl-tRNA synthetase alpha chain
MIEELNKIKEEVLKAIDKASDSNALRELEIKYLGRKGELTRILRNLATLSEDQRKSIGQLANDVKNDLAKKFEEAGLGILSKGSGKHPFVDVTLPGIKIDAGHLNPITQIQNELSDFFTSMGFLVLEGPELESDYFNFEALNISKTHPARDMQDTFYVDIMNKADELDLVMRTHTSPMQVRSMLKYGAPLRCVIPGRCFRNEATDIRHEHTFYQIEGLVVDRGISIANMKGVMEAVVKFLFGKDVKLRMRPKFYPFVEPGANGEVTCVFCQGKGCRLCKQTGWLEIVGSGMVHPNVLRAGDIDPEEYSGFAFGFGLNRLAQLKYGIEDARMYNSGDLRFLEQF